MRALAAVALVLACGVAGCTRTAAYRVAARVDKAWVTHHRAWTQMLPIIHSTGKSTYTTFIPIFHPAFDSYHAVVIRPCTLQVEVEESTYQRVAAGAEAFVMVDGDTR